MHYKNLKGKTERESPKMIIYANDELEPLQIVSELDTGQCVSEGAEPRRGVDTRTSQVVTQLSTTLPQARLTAEF